MTGRRARRWCRAVISTCRDVRRALRAARDLRKDCPEGGVEQPHRDRAERPGTGDKGTPASPSTPPEGLPPGLTRRQFLEDLLDAMGDADAVVFHRDPDGTEYGITRGDLLAALAEEMD